MRARLHISTAATTTATIRKHSNHDARRQDSRSGTYDPEMNAFEKYPKRTSWNNVPSALKAPSDDIMEVYSRPRIVPLAVARGMIGELSVDLVTGYNMNLPEVVSTVVAEVLPPPEGPSGVPALHHVLSVASHLEPQEDDSRGEGNKDERGAASLEQ